MLQIYGAFFVRIGQLRRVEKSCLAPSAPPVVARIDANEPFRTTFPTDRAIRTQAGRAHTGLRARYTVWVNSLSCTGWRNVTGSAHTSTKDAARSCVNAA